MQLRAVMGLGINTIIQNQTAILECEGQIVRGEEIDVLYGEIMLQQVPVVVLDLQKVNKVDAAGLGILVRAHQSLSAANRRLRLQNVSEWIMELLQKTNLQQLFEISASRQEDEWLACASAACCHSSPARAR